MTSIQVRLAASMKENSYAMEQGMSTASKLLDKTESLLDSNVNTVKKANETATDVYKKTWVSRINSDSDQKLSE